MNKSPFLNALAATAYITAITLFLSQASQIFGPVDNKIVSPILFLSLLVLSVALMGYFFVYQPARLFLENKQKEATRFFFSTVAFFVGSTIVVVLIGLFVSTLF